MERLENKIYEIVNRELSAKANNTHHSAQRATYLIMASLLKGYQRMIFDLLTEQMTAKEIGLAIGKEAKYVSSQINGINRQSNLIVSTRIGGKVFYKRLMNFA